MNKTRSTSDNTCRMYNIHPINFDSIKVHCQISTIQLMHWDSGKLEAATVLRNMIRNTGSDQLWEYQNAIRSGPK